MREIAMPQLLSFRPAVLGASALALVGCSDSQPPAQAQAPAPAVTVVKVASEEVRPTLTFTGRIEAKDKIDLRARVDGFLEKRLFTEGADVKEGDLLFVIEKGLYEAAVEQAKGALEKAQAALKLADLEVDRQAELLRRNVAAQAKLDEVTAKQGEARGDVLGQKAALEKAQLQLTYTEIRAPLAGRIGRASVSVGNYVTAQSSALATIVSQDPIYVSFPVTQREILAIRKARAEGTTGGGTESVIYVQLADGSRYPRPGKFDFLDVTVNQGTDTVQVRAVFPNPDRVLVDGQLVTVIAEGARDSGAAAGPAARSVRQLRVGRGPGQQDPGAAHRARRGPRRAHDCAQGPRTRRERRDRRHPAGAPRAGRAADRSEAAGVDSCCRASSSTGLASRRSFRS
jgi:membrane fusion protein, multidrug efflux system